MCTLEDGRPHGSTLIVQLAGLDGSRSCGDVLRWRRRRVREARCPRPRENECYWSDLVGLAVWNRQGERLGIVAAVQDFGAHPVLRVERRRRVARLIPFVEAYVDAVDLAAGRIEVDWQKDYS